MRKVKYVLFKSINKEWFLNELQLDSGVVLDTPNNYFAQRDRDKLTSCVYNPYYPSIFTDNNSKPQQYLNFGAPHAKDFIPGYLIKNLQALLLNLL